MWHLTQAMLPFNFNLVFYALYDLHHILFNFLIVSLNILNSLLLRVLAVTTFYHSGNRFHLTVLKFLPNFD